METNICRVCGGKGNTSKGIINIHNIQHSLKPYTTVEFEDKLVTCIKCEKCGHSWIPQSDRELALEWWKTQSPLSQATLIRGYNYITNINSITGREIEEIWKKETI